nr:hypothetical protein [Tanacetum cinerariifolium]
MKNFDVMKENNLLLKKSLKNGIVGQIPRTHRQKRQKLSPTSETMGQRTSTLLEEETLGDEEEEYPLVNKYPSFQEDSFVLVEEEPCPVYDTDNEEKQLMPVYDNIEDVIEEEEGFVRKGGFSGEEDNIEDVIVVANDICYLMIQTNLSVDFEEDINTKSHGLMSFGKSIIIKNQKDVVDDKMEIRRNKRSLFMCTLPYLRGPKNQAMYPLVDGDVEEVGDLSMKAMEDEEVAMVDGVFEVTFGALGDETWCFAEGVLVSS